MCGRRCSIDVRATGAGDCDVGYVVDGWSSMMRAVVDCCSLGLMLSRVLREPTGHEALLELRVLRNRIREFDWLESR